MYISLQSHKEIQCQPNNLYFHNEAKFPIKVLKKNKYFTQSKLKNALQFTIFVRCLIYNLTLNHLCSQNILSLQKQNYKHKITKIHINSQIRKTNQMSTSFSFPCMAVVTEMTEPSIPYVSGAVKWFVPCPKPI